MKENTFEVVEEILFRVGEVRVRKRVCERVEVEGGIHVGRWWSGWKKRSVASKCDAEMHRREDNEMWHMVTTEYLSVFAIVIFQAQFVLPAS